MPRKTHHQRFSRGAVRQCCFNEAAARCRGKLRVPSTSSVSVISLQ